jgi:hypothetical protein
MTTPVNVVLAEPVTLAVVAFLAAGLIGVIGEWIKKKFTQLYKKQEIVIKFDGKEIKVSGDRNDLHNAISRAVEEDSAKKTE